MAVYGDKITMQKEGVSYKPTYQWFQTLPQSLSGRSMSIPPLGIPNIRVD